MITEIGIVSGDILHCLEQNGEVSLDSLVEKIGKSKDLVLMGIGWLGREGHVILKQENSEYLCALRKKEE